MKKQYRKEILSLILREIISIKKEREALIELFQLLFLEADFRIKQNLADFLYKEIGKTEQVERQALYFLYNNIVEGGYFYSAFEDSNSHSSEEECDYDDFEVVEEEEEEE